MANYREIVTKTVIGKGKKTFIDTGNVKPDNSPSTILGCWIINHNFGGNKIDDSVNINGSYDLNIWYSFDNNSKTDVIKQKVSYNEVVHIKNRGESTEQEVIVRSLRQPTCSKVDIENGVINYIIEKDLGIELVGNEKVKIAIDDNEDPWDEILDDTEDKKIDNEVNEKFIKDEETI